jgi:hypothetical protein
MTRPIALVPDPEKRIFSIYGVERGWAGRFSFAVMREYVRALRAGFPAGMLTSDGGITGSPADVRINRYGRVVYANYGKRYADSLESSEIAEICPKILAALTKQNAEETRSAELNAENALHFIGSMKLRPLPNSSRDLRQC